MRWLLVLFALLVCTSCSAEESSLVRVTEVIDGDTFALEHPNSRVRIAYIDAPEKGRRYYAESKAALQELIEGKLVYLKLVCNSNERDACKSWGRDIATVYSDSGRNIGLHMVGMGHAEPHDTYLPADEIEAETLRNLYLQALTYQRGMWATTGGKIVSSEHEQKQ